VIEFRMPSLGAEMDFGTVLEWRVRPGDAVRRGDIVALVDTEKAEIEVEIWESGVVESIVVPVGTKVPVGALLAQLRAAGEAPPGVAAPQPPRVAAPPIPAPAAPAPPAPAAPPLRAPEGARIRATPLARRIAADLGVDLARVRGTGPEGEITRRDIEAAAAPAVAAPAPAPADRSAALRRAIAAAMARSKREIPHYYLETAIEMTRALAWLEAENLRRPLPERLLPAALVLKAVALALRDSPELCGTWVEGGFRPASGIHVGVAISLRGGGTLAPAIRDADRHPLGELMAALRDLVSRTRRGVLRGSEVTDAAITVTNLGDQGVEKVFGVIYPPQVALVGFGRISERPWAEHGMVGVRPVLAATLSADHRASDGVQGARLLGAIARLLQEPERL
jgi:pyruvate dehydrogenase E2 component (dihydrolipoamide acetyltransferase)